MLKASASVWDWAIYLELISLKGVAAMNLHIPLQIDQWFHGKSTTDSTANRPVVPREIDHLSWRAPTGGGGV